MNEFADLPPDDPSTTSSESELLSPEFAAAAAALRKQAVRFGNAFRMLDDGTIVDVEMFDSIRNRWTSRLPSRPPVAEP
jgi:hypothetical protein